jgi:hypothetical protein
MIRRAEAQRVHRRDGPRAHGEDIAQDAADAGGRALVGLDVGGVVVALHLEDDAIAVADIDDAGVLAGPWITRGPVGRQGSSATSSRICRSSARSTWPRRCRVR